MKGKRRANNKLSEVSFGGLNLSSDNALVTANSTSQLPPRLALLFRALAAGRGRSVSRRELLDTVWGPGQGSSQKLSKAISDLRRILRRHGADQIESVYGSGYRLVPEDEANTGLMLREKVRTLCAEAGHRVHERSRDSFRIAEMLYTMALELDPRCSDAHLGLAEVKIYGLQVGFWPAASAWQLARAHLDIVRQIDPDCLRLYVLLSLGLGLIEDDLAAASELQSEIQRCNRGLPVGHPVPSYLHLAGGRPDLAAGDLHIALERDPALVPALTIMPYALMCAGQHADALHAAARSLAADPTSLEIKAMCGWVTAALGQSQDAVRLTSLAHTGRPASTNIAAIHAYALARNGNQETAIRVLEYDHGQVDCEVSATSMAAVAWMALGRRDKAIESLRRAMDERCFWRRIVFNDPRLDSLRDEPKVRALMAGSQVSQSRATAE